jgi:light-regulated signal transduction histidine kinase (bacteriophytochrome)
MQQSTTYLPESKAPLTDTLSATEDSHLVLQRLQEDMELFSYVASHDLLAPVRIILSYCEELKTTSMTSEQQQTLQGVFAESEHMKALLLGLQEYIRLEAFKPKLISLDANELLASAIDGLGDEIRTANAIITHDSMPLVSGHRGRLTRLFFNLIENALKFRSLQQPEIHISVRPGNDFHTFCIEDNGLGIEPEHQEVMFRLFQRLHAPGAYSGYGVGLALSQKIVTAHNGKIWVDSAPGKGSRFFFTLPASGSD